METLWSAEGELRNIVFGQLMLGDGSLDVSRIPPFRDAFLLFWIDAAPNRDSSQCGRQMKFNP